MGRLLVVADRGLKEIHINNIPSLDLLRARHREVTDRFNPVVELVLCRLDSYFRGERVSFCDIPLNPEGTVFLKTLWEGLRTIPYGEVITYGELASKYGTSPRAVGLACRKNPIPIVVPCHRVVAKGLLLYNYSGGIETKGYLLRLEGKKVTEDNFIIP